MSQSVGSFGFALTFVCKGLGKLSEQDLTVLMVKPDGTTLERTGPDDVEALTDEQLGVRIKEGDLDQAGTYSYQVIRTTIPGESLKTSIGTFLVESSLSPP